MTTKLYCWRVEQTISIRIKKDNQYRYIVSWQDKNIPHGDLSRNSFVTDEILWEYWNNSKLPKKSKPQEFRKERLLSWREEFAQK
jgi:hypothetical protein